MATRIKGLDVVEIIPDFLYLGSASASKNLEGLQKCQITHIVNLAGKAYFPDRFEYLTFHFRDNNDEALFPGVLSVFERLARLEAEHNGKVRVLVHCMGGVSRSPSFVIGYLMQRFNLSFDTALARVKAARPGARPNSNFVSQLKEFEATLDIR